jgi:tRNA uridine 5-carboxymethylaminomethyl modification enzyme
MDRLSEVSKKIGIVSEKELEILNQLNESRLKLKSDLASGSIYPKPEVNEKIVALGSTPLLKPATFEEFLRRPEVNFQFLKQLGFLAEGTEEVFEAVEIDVKYSGYIKKQNDLIEKAKQLEQLLIPPTIVYKNVKGLSNEEVDKLSRIRPRTLGQAQRISGVNPSALQCLMIHLKGHHITKGINLEQSNNNSGPAI